ncbi:MAG: hypothetical protein JXB50_04050 [Spirochaetes bacterium]|nr:hypothetical protein [Spirochaetota bacterium]
MKKFFFIMILMLSFHVFFAQESSLPQVNGFEKYLNEYLGKDIVVSVLNVDTNIEGKLIEIYTDGIIVETTLLRQRVFILKNSIAFIKKKFELKVK